MIFVLVFLSYFTDNLEGWDGVGDGREVQEGRGICVPIADSYSCVAGQLSSVQSLSRV